MNVIIIPARMGSKRLPGKPLAIIDGEPMVVRCARMAAKSLRADSIIVATDDRAIARAVWNAKFPKLVTTCMTDPNCTSGTDRIASLTYSQLERSDIVLNWQGDLPFADARIADQLFDLMGHKTVDMATACNIRQMDDYRYKSPHTVKVMMDDDTRAVAFTRGPICNGMYWLHHFGMYTYRVPVLQRLYKTPQTDFEKREGLEQLRAMHIGIPINVLVTEYEPGIEINTAEDLEAINGTERIGTEATA